jgi:hypothetical protein
MITDEDIDEALDHIIPKRKGPPTPRQEAFATVAGWIEERLGKKVAHDWVWTCTPYPFGPPTDAMLAEGLAIATGELDPEDLRARIEHEMNEANRKFRREQEAAPDV